MTRSAAGQSHGYGSPGTDYDSCAPPEPSTRAAPAESPPREPARGHPHVFDRQIRAFGRDGQALLGDLRVAVIVAGGTGSAVAVLLARLGVGTLILVDPQTPEDTKVPRAHGGTLGDVGRAKVDVLADHTRTLSSAAETTIPPAVGFLSHRTA